MGLTLASQPPSMRKFFTIFTGQAFSLFGSRLVQFALVWWLTTISSGSASVLAFASIVALLPQIVLSPFAGSLVDRWNRRVVMIVADAGIALTVVVLAVLYALNIVEIWHVYALMFVGSIGGSFHFPAMQASTTLMVPQRHLTRVAGLNQSLNGMANIVAPPLGALLLATLPMHNILAIDVGTAIIAILPLIFISIPQPLKTDPSGGGKTSILGDIVEAMRYVWSWKGLLFLLVGIMMVNLLFVPAASLAPVLITSHFEGGVVEYAFFQSAVGVGIVLGGLTLGVWGGFKRRIVTGIFALVMAGIGVTIVGLTPSAFFFLAVGAMFYAGFMIPIINGSMVAIFQTTIPPEMQGRVFTLITSGATLMTPVGLAIAGPVADALGVQIWFIIGGIAMIATGLTSLFVPAIMRIGE